jgi:hypothetical protein
VNCAEDTLTEIGSKWPKKQKRRSEVRENESLDEKIEENRSSKEDGSWTTQQVEKSTNGCFGAPHGKEGKTGWRSPENVGQVDLGF